MLTTVCLASKYPEAIPLKEISAEAVAEGMLEIWSCTGIPKEILKDQGTQFMSKLLKQLCSRLRIKMVRSSPYHPQTNGALERFHGTLVPMLRKLTEDHGQWPGQLKFCLYAMLTMPHRDTGFSPFEVVYGCNLHTPLELLYDSWLEPDCVSVNLISWMEKFDTRVRTVRECLRERLTELKACERVRQEMVKLRTFKAGDLVLFKTPGMNNKLSMMLGKGLSEFVNAWGR